MPCAAGGIQCIAERPQSALQAPLYYKTLISISSGDEQLILEGEIGVLETILPVPSLDDPLRGKSDQHANHDNAYFAEKLTPAVQRLWKMEVNVKAPLL